METQGVQLLFLLLLCAVSTCWGQQDLVYLTLGSGPVITTNNVEIQITTIGEDGGLPSLTCHTDLTTCCRSADNNGNGALGQWTYPNGSMVLQYGGSLNAGQQFYILRGGPQLIRLARREATNSLTPTGSYCCTVPTTGGDITLCANLVAPTSVTCSDNLLAPTNGGITYAGGSTDNRPVGATATYSCITGYTLNGGTTRTCGSDGEWSGSTPTCQGPTEPPTICPDLTVPANGMIGYNMGTGSPRPVDTVATYTCNPGYTLSGDSTRTCGSGGVWSGFAPTCQPNCPDLPSLTNGMIMYSAGSTDNRPFLSSAVHSCNTGYTITGGTLNGGTTRVCVTGGNWDGSPPTCQVNTGPTDPPPTTCSDLIAPTNGMIGYNNMGTASQRPVNTMATYTCNPGYTLNGGSTRTCGSDGLWSGSAPTCQLSCGPPPSITNGSPGQPTSTMIGGEVTYTCDTGFILIGSETIICLNTGNWSSSPSCQIPPPVYLSLSSTNYLSGLSEIPLSSVGEGSDLVCHTDLVGCCEGNTGDWYYPNGSVVMEDGVLYVSRGQMSISLMMSGTAAALGGLYCCMVPTSGGTSTACIVLASTDESSPCPQSDNTGAVVGGVVALVAVVVVIAVTVVMVTYLVLWYKRGGKMTVPRDIPLTDQGQSAAATYETVPATYEEIPASREVKGDYSYTQNNAYSTVSGREAPAGGIYNKTELSHDSSRK
ncbi:sushi, von Willebrand factor type A, EGF and pentraxin domain-containing protein 1-like isoform X2 [Halichondria panicea]|uniref:sushi, von Willebrand factor type A, EGF and pentraxin domain-containing protein 1-like isoform X2 n=1 Tax=Halichondria panicea TaxID=6063 RepID=UPI00312BC05E